VELSTAAESPAARSAWRQVNNVAADRHINDTTGSRGGKRTPRPHFRRAAIEGGGRHHPFSHPGDRIPSLAFDLADLASCRQHR
jgi:hypothetical protein